MRENIKSSIRLNGDDTLLYREIHSLEDSRIFQEDINRLQEWANCWMMKSNPIKCEYLRVTNKSLPFTTQYYINDVMVRQVQHDKYLGFYIDETLSWNFHVDYVCNKANS